MSAVRMHNDRHYECVQLLLDYGLRMMKPALMQMFRYKCWQIGEISSKWRRLILELLAIIVSIFKWLAN